MKYNTRVVGLEEIGNNLKKLIIRKPNGFEFISGQHTMIFLESGRPFSITSRNEEENLEFLIKIYPGHDGFTKKINKLEIGDELMIEDARGSIKFEGNGVFIAGGTGIAPFISIAKNFAEKEKNTLIFSNKTREGIILMDKLKKLFGETNFTLTQEKKEGYENGRITKKFIEEKIKDFDQIFYICGPAQFVASMKTLLSEFKIKKIVTEF